MLGTHRLPGLCFRHLPPTYHTHPLTTPTSSPLLRIALHLCPSVCACVFDTYCTFTLPLVLRLLLLLVLRLLLLLVVLLLLLVVVLLYRLIRCTGQQWLPTFSDDGVEISLSRSLSCSVVFGNFSCCCCVLLLALTTVVLSIQTLR
jgi:hypothetical protein